MAKKECNNKKNKKKEKKMHQMERKNEKKKSGSNFSGFKDEILLNYQAPLDFFTSTVCFFWHVLLYNSRQNTYIWHNTTILEIKLTHKKWKIISHRYC